MAFPPALLEKHGLEVRFAALFDRPTALGAGDDDLGHWIYMFGAAFTTGLSPEGKAELIRRAETQLREEFFRDGA